jgi:glycosyltransferase involved in cell wall biosynthesis
MRILIVSFYYFPELGAAPSRITNMAEGLRKQGAYVDVLTCLPNYPKGRIFDGYRGRFSKKENVNGINVYRYWTFASISQNPFARFLGMCTFGMTMWAFVLKCQKIHTYDKVIIQTPPILVAFSAIILFKCLYRKETVLNISDLWPLSAVELGAVREGSSFYKVMAWIERFIYKHTTWYQGQSKGIIEHVQTFEPTKKYFLYRNLQHHVPIPILQIERKPFKIIYAGLLGVAQDILGIIKHIKFKELCAEFHLYGGGNQTIAIESFLKDNDIGVFYHGYLDKSVMAHELLTYHASIVPLAVRIKGAVPSKIFDLLTVGVPSLFCGGGEGADIVTDYKIGLVSSSGDFAALQANIQTMMNLSDTEYQALKKNCLTASSTDFSFEKQIKKYYTFLSSSC